MPAGVVARLRRPRRTIVSPSTPPHPGGQPAHVGAPRRAHSTSGAAARSKGCCVFPFGLPHFTASPIRRNAPPAHPLRKRRGAPDVRARPSAAQAMHELQRLHQILRSRDDAPVRRAPHPVGFPRPRASTRPFPAAGAQLAGLREAMRRTSYVSPTKMSERVISPTLPRASRQRPCSAVAWACLKTLPYGDSVAGSVVAAATGGVLGVRCTGSVGGGSDSLCGGLRRGELSRSALAHEPTLGLRQRATLQAQRPGAIHRPWCALYRYVAAGWR